MPGTDDVGQVEDRFVNAVGVVQRPSGAGGRLGQHRLAGRHPGGVEGSAERGQCRQHRDVDGVHAECEGDHRDRGHRRADSASEIIDTRRRPM